MHIQALADWPPESEGDKAIATKWFALAKGGVLFLAEKPATSNNKYVPVVSVPLPGCSIHIPTEGLRGKSKCATLILPEVDRNSSHHFQCCFSLHSRHRKLRPAQMVEEVSAGDQPPRKGAALSAKELLPVCI